MKRVFAVSLLAGSTLLAATAQTPPVCTLGGLKVPGFAVKSLPREEFTKLHAAVAPKGEGERWIEIPWESDLIAAREKAAREKKPLLMWVMDGHPLGCT
jgi:hypothetical protein